VLVLLGALVATFFIFAAVGMRFALRAREVRVPDVIGRPVAEATDAMAGAGLTLRVDEVRRADLKVPEGHIVQQDPPPGVEARRQRTVRVWLSTGPRAASVPPLVGQTERTARIRLDQDGLSVGALTEIRSPDYPSDAVVAQAPPPETRGDKVYLLINRGEQATSFVMPDVIGVDGNRAAALLRSHGLRVSLVGQQPYPGIPAGTVVRQDPPGGFQVAPSDPIAIEVSR
jgi:serine/threonine-protein kinase